MFSGYSWDIGGGVSYKRCCSPNYSRTSQERMAPVMALPSGRPFQTLSNGGNVHLLFHPECLRQ